MFERDGDSGGIDFKRFRRGRPSNTETEETAFDVREDRLASESGEWANLLLASFSFGASG